MFSELSWLDQREHMKRIIDDLLWLLSLGATFKFWSSLYEGVQHHLDGLPISWLFLGLIFLVVNAWLQIKSLQQAEEKDKRRIVWQTLSVYCIATAFNVIVITTFFLRGGGFSMIDASTVTVVLGASVIVWRRHPHKVPELGSTVEPAGPFSKAAIGEYAGAFKGIPQIFLMINILDAYFLNNLAKLAVTWQANFWQHSIGILRLVQVVRSYLRQKDAPTRASLVSEIFNEISLALVSIAMAYVTYAQHVGGGSQR